MKKIIAHIVQLLYDEGGLEALVTEMQQFATTQEEVHIISLEGTKKEALKARPNLINHANRLHFLNKQPGIQLNCFSKLIKLFKRLEVDIIHTHHIGPLLYGGLAAYFAKIPSIIHTEHDAWHLQDRKERYIQRFLLKLTKPKLVADGMMVAEQLKNNIEGYPSIVIYNGVDINKFTPGNKKIARKYFNFSEDIYLIGCAARLEENKGIQILIKALAQLPSHIHLAIAGIGPYEKPLKKTTDQMNLNSRVYFLGHVDEMPTYYQSLDLFCLSSLMEGMPLVLLEAQAANVPVVTTNVGSCSEAVCPESGSLIEVDNISALVEAINRQLKRKNNIKPREYVIKERSLVKMMQAYQLLYHEK